VSLKYLLCRCDLVEKKFLGAPALLIHYMYMQKIGQFLIENAKSIYKNYNAKIRKTPQLKNQSDTARLTPTYGKLFFHIKKNIHKYILKESVVSNPICQVLYLATSLLKKKMIHPVFANECERKKKKKTYFCTPHMSRPAAFNKKKQTTNVTIICPIQ